jgi:hypothetical protein
LYKYSIFGVMQTFDVSGIVFTLSPQISPVKLTVNINSTGRAQVGLPFSLEGSTNGTAIISGGNFAIFQLDTTSKTWKIVGGSTIAPTVPAFISSVANTATVNLAVSANQLTASFASLLISQFTNDSEFIDLEDLSAVAPLVYDNTTGAFSTSMATNKLIGRGTAATGVMEEITLGTGLSLTGTTLNSTGGTVTNVSALTIGTTGTDLSSSVATSTTTPVITLNVPTASAANRGALSAADWTAFNSKQATISVTTPITLSGASVGIVNQGTTTTVMHGNAAGNASFSAVDLTTDVTGVLPAANGGAGAAYISRHFDCITVGVNPSGATYYLGSQGVGLAAITTPQRRQFSFPFAVHLVAASIVALTGNTTVSNEAATVYLREANTTDSQITNAMTFTTGIVCNNTDVTGLNIAVPANTLLEIKIVFPTFASGPTNWNIGGDLFFTKD